MEIIIKNARVHNLKNVNLTLPRGKLIIFTGISGSGKSSLVFDTIFAAAQSEYFESMSSYARRSLPRFPPPEVDVIEGLSPGLSIDQRPMGGNIRSTVGTSTEIYTLLRLLYSRLGEPRLNASDYSFNTPAGACPVCKGLGVQVAVVKNILLDFDKSLAEGAIMHRTWKVKSRYWNIIQASRKFDMNKPLNQFTDKEMDVLLNSEPEVLKNNEPGYVQSFSFEGVASRLLKRQKDERGLDCCDYDKEFLREGPCVECGGSRLNKRARSVKIQGLSITNLVDLELADLVNILDKFDNSIARTVLASIRKKISYLLDSGVGYLTLNRGVSTLSGGESQRVKLSRQLGSSLTEMIYVLDEPTVGLHPSDVERMCGLLKGLSKRGNTVLVVEHDQEVMRVADLIVELGRGAGILGGNIIAEGSPKDMATLGTPTGIMLSSRSTAQIRKNPRSPHDYFFVKNANINNLKNIDVDIPKNMLVCITGISGSGKSSLVQVLSRKNPKFVVVDQSAIGRSPRSNIATYVDAFTAMRIEIAQATHQDPSLFTFNGQGACEECGGLGYTDIDMHFLGDVRKTCETCNGKRYKPQVLGFRYKDKDIAEILAMTVSEAKMFFITREIKDKLGILADVGLDYLQLGQPLDTLSGGESQRAKLAERLNKKGQVYILDEPTRGLHLEDVHKLIKLLDKLVSHGNSVIVVEHNLDIIAMADWIVDIGPGGGKEGGKIVAQGPPMEIMAKEDVSITGKYLKRYFQVETDRPA